MRVVFSRVFVAIYYLPAVFKAVNKAKTNAYEKFHPSQVHIYGYGPKPDKL